MMSTLRGVRSGKVALRALPRTSAALSTGCSRVGALFGCQPGCGCKKGISFGSAPVGVGAQMRNFSLASPAVKKLATKIASEVKYENENYEKPTSPVPAGWSFIEKPGDVNLCLEKSFGDKSQCKIEWQLSSPYDPEKEADENAPTVNETDFTLTIIKGELGMTLFCSTSQGEERLVIGNVKNWTTHAERDNIGAYNGPDFEDLDEGLQEILDEFLGELGLSDDVYTFIESMSQDKEAREYIRWLENMGKVIS